MSHACYRAEQARFSNCNELDGVELLTAQFIEHRYAFHTPSTYAIAVLESGAARYRQRGAEHIASLGDMFCLIRMNCTLGIRLAPVVGATGGLSLLFYVAVCICWREAMLRLLQGYAGIAPGYFRCRETTAVSRAKELLEVRLADAQTLGVELG